MEVAGEERQGGHVVDRDREEALDLAGVEVHRQHAVGAGRLEHRRDETGADRLARRRLLVLARVREERQHRGDLARRGKPGGVDHQQQLEQMVVHRRRAGLDDEEVGPADRLAVTAVDLAVGERLELDVASPTPSRRPIASARAGFERPENSISACDGRPSRRCATSCAEPARTRRRRRSSPCSATGASIRGSPRAAASWPPPIGRAASYEQAGALARPRSFAAGGAHQRPAAARPGRSGDLKRFGRMTDSSDASVDRVLREKALPLR